MRLVIAVLVLLTMYLQYGLWYTRGGKHDVEKLQASVAEQKDEIARLKERNRSLSAEVIDLKQGLEAIEERARSEMGMIKNGEVFFRITDPNHEHDKPHNVTGSGANGADQPLEPPLDPVAPGDAAMNDGVDVPSDGQDPPTGGKPVVAAIARAAAKKTEALPKSSVTPSLKAAAGTAKAGKPDNSTARPPPPPRPRPNPPALRRSRPTTHPRAALPLPAKRRRPGRSVNHRQVPPRRRTLRRQRRKQKPRAARRLPQRARP